MVSRNYKAVRDQDYNVANSRGYRTDDVTDVRVAQIPEDFVMATGVDKTIPFDNGTKLILVGSAVSASSFKYYHGTTLLETITTATANLSEPEPINENTLLVADKVVANVTFTGSCSVVKVTGSISSGGGGSASTEITANASGLDDLTTRSVSKGSYSVTVAGSSKVAQIVDPGFTVDEINIVKAYLYDTAGARQDIPLSTLSIAADSSSYNVTFSDKSDNFNANDTVEIVTVTSPYTIDETADAQKVAEVNPVSTLYSNPVSESASYTGTGSFTLSLDMRDQRFFNYVFDNIACVVGTGSCTLTLEESGDDVAVGSANFEDFTNDYFGVASYSIDSTSDTGLKLANDTPQRTAWVRVKGVYDVTSLAFNVNGWTGV